MAEFENVVILVSDALRYDYVPKSIAEKGVIPTLAPSLHTPTSFASLHTASSPENHNVRGFLDNLDPEMETAFDHFENYSFWDGPETSSILNHIYGGCEIKDLEEMEPPFIWVERMLQTHLPYGETSHYRNEEFELSGWEYIEKMRKGEINAAREYKKGPREMEKYFHTVIQKLEEKEILDETLVVLTSDHGELLGERYLGQKRYEHNYPPLQELAQVPTVFYNHDLDAESMRLIDLVPTVLSLTGRKSDIGDGVDLTKETVRKGRNIMDDPKAFFDTTWRFVEGEWVISLRDQPYRAIKTALGDLKKYVYNHGGEELKQKLEERTKQENPEGIIEDIDI